MGYGGKWVERERARELRAQSWTLLEIANELGVSKSSVSLWCRDVEFVPKPRNRGHSVAQAASVDAQEARGDRALPSRCRDDRRAAVAIAISRCSASACTPAKAAKTRRIGDVRQHQPDLPVRCSLRLVADEHSTSTSRGCERRSTSTRGSTSSAATAFWSGVLDLPVDQFTKPYRAVADATRRHAKHVHGCATLTYSCTPTHRRVMAMIEAVTSPFAIPG